jgi:hypothetical protein
MRRLLASAQTAALPRAAGATAKANAMSIRLSFAAAEAGVRGMSICPCVMMCPGSASCTEPLSWMNGRQPGTVQPGTRARARRHESRWPRHSGFLRPAWAPPCFRCLRAQGPAATAHGQARRCRPVNDGAPQARRAAPGEPERTDRRDSPGFGQGPRRAQRRLRPGRQEKHRRTPASHPRPRPATRGHAK